MGHGSRNPASHQELTILGDLVRQLEPEYKIILAYLQLREPNLDSVIRKLTDEGETEVIVIPVFLFMGNHISEDIPELINNFKIKYPDLQVRVGSHLGPEWRIASLVRDRIGAVKNDINQKEENGKNIRPIEFIRNPKEIESRSFAIIGRELEPYQQCWKPAELEVVKRVVHATADLDWAELINFHHRAVEAGIKALREGVPIITDVRMSLVGIGKRPAEKFGSELVCYIDHPEVVEANSKTGKTRSMLGIAKACDGMERGIVVIGNAPTALFELVDLIVRGKTRPDLIVGTPVGFVGAAESKEMLKDLGVPYIRTIGRKGGSTVAAAIVNALSKLAEQDL